MWQMCLQRWICRSKSFEFRVTSYEKAIHLFVSESLFHNPKLKTYLRLSKTAARRPNKSKVLWVLLMSL